MTTGTTPGTTPKADGRYHDGNHPRNPCDCRPVPPPVPPGTTSRVQPGTGTTHVVGTGPGTTFTALLRACAWPAVTVTALVAITTTTTLPPVEVISPPALVALVAQP